MATLLLMRRELLNPKHFCRHRILTPKLISTTPPRKVPPWAIFLVKPFSRLLAMFLGRKGRLWWRNLPEAEKTLRNHLKRNRGLIAGSSIAFAIFLGSFGYGSHLEESQISGRKRFIALRKDQMEEVAQQEFEQHLETFDEVLLPENHPYYDRVAKVAARILDSNTEYEEIRTKKWTISVVDQKDQNAFVLPSATYLSLQVC